MNRVLRAFVVFGITALGACDGASGDPCQIEDDCNSGLLCCDVGQLGNRGTCRDSCSVQIQDAATSSDARMSTVDAAADGAQGLPDASGDAGDTVDASDSADASADAASDSGDVGQDGAVDAAPAP